GLYQGDRLFLAACENGWLFVLEVAASSSRVLRRAVLRPPLVQNGAYTVVGDGDLWLFGDGGRGLRLSAATLRPLSWQGRLPQGKGRLPFLADACSLWLLAEAPGRCDQVSVADLQQGQVCRELGAMLRPVPIYGGA